METAAFVGYKVADVLGLVVAFSGVFLLLLSFLLSSKLFKVKLQKSFLLLLIRTRLDDL